MEALPSPPPAVLPVIHLLDLSQGVHEARRAFEAGATGVVLIDHGPCDGSQRMALERSVLTLETAEEAWFALRESGVARPWIGVNFLGLSPAEAFDFLHQKRAVGIAGVWCDGPARGVVKHPASEGVWAATYFAGVAFKYQTVTMSLEAEALLALGHGADVLTTSGPGTGLACDPEKVRRLRALAPPRVGVAVASGVDVTNARPLIEAGASHLLVASSLAEAGDFHRLDQGKLRELLAEVARVQPPLRAVV